MSLLLDALNKADQERKRNEATPGINSNHEQVTDASSHKKAIFITAVLVAGFMMLLAGIYWLGQRSATTVSAPAVEVSSAATASQNNSIKSSIETAKLTIAPNKTTIDRIASGSNTNTADEIDTSEENVASLYQQNIQSQTTNATLTINAPDIAPPAHPTPNQINEETPVSPRSITQFANLPDLHDLPSQILERIPSLNYSEHNYNINGGSVKINGTIHHAQDQLGAGVVIDKILEDGMILHVDNYSFKMRALNSWVNM